MNTQEAIQYFKDKKKAYTVPPSSINVSIGEVINIISRIDEPRKPVVPQVAVDYYEQYKDRLTGFDEWFADFYESSFVEDFPKAEELQIWLYDNDKETNGQRELALATLIVNGVDAVEAEQDKRYHVELKLTEQELIYSEETGSFYFDHFSLKKEISNAFTKSELEKAGFGEVFDNPMFKVVEVNL